MCLHINSLTDLYIAAVEKFVDSTALTKQHLQPKTVNAIENLLYMKVAVLKKNAYGEVFDWMDS